MSDYRRSEIISGLFVTLAAVVFGLFAFKVGRFDLMGLFKGETVAARTYFLNVKTLQVGSQVRVGGREVGEVTDLRLVEDPTPAAGEGGTLKRLVNEVTFELGYPELRLDPASSGVLLAQDSLLAPHYLELDPGRWPADSPPPLILEAEWPVGLVLASEENLGIEELMAKAPPVIDELTAVLEKLNRELFTPQNIQAIGRVIADLEGAVADGRQIAATLHRDVLAPDNVEALDRVVHDLEAAVADSRSAAARLDAFLDAEQDPRLDRLLTEVTAATSEMRTHLDAVTADLRELLENTDRVVSVAETELVEATRRLQQTLWQGEMALRKIRANPALLFFGDDETDLEARDLDLTEIRQRGRARPYEQRDEKDDD